MAFYPQIWYHLEANDINFNIQSEKVRKTLVSLKKLPFFDLLKVFSVVFKLFYLVYIRNFENFWYHIKIESVSFQMTPWSMLFDLIFMVYSGVELFLTY